MDLKQIARELVEGMREGDARVRENLTKLYDRIAVSVEAEDMGDGREAVGLEAISAKHDWWESAMEMHSAEITGPFCHGEEQFSVFFAMDVTEKASGRRMQMQEIGVYHVRDGKIVREEFHYALED